MSETLHQLSSTFNKNASTNEGILTNELWNDVIDESMSNFRDINCLTPEELSDSMWHDETRYRSVGVLPATGYFNTFHSTNSNINTTSFFNGMEKPTLKKSASNSIYKSNIASASSFQIVVDRPNFQPTLNVSELGRSSSNSFSPTTIPDVPSYLLPTHFHVPMLIDASSLQAGVTTCLKNIGELTFEFDAMTPKWSGFFVKGSTSSLIDIHIYSNKSKSFIIEAVRIKGDACAFHQVFRELKNFFAADQRSVETEFLASAIPLEPEQRQDSFLFATYPGVDNDLFLDDHDAAKTLQSIIAMAETNGNDARLEACKILNDISSNDSSLEQLRENGCIALLVQSLATGCDYTKLNAMLTLTNISEAHSCQEAIIESGVIPALLSMIADGSNHTCETRRACARILANLSSRLATRVAEAVEASRMTQFLESIDSISDSKLRLHADRARCALRPAMAMIGVSNQSSNSAVFAS